MIQKLYTNIFLLILMLSQVNCLKVLHFKPKYKFFNGSSSIDNTVILESQSLISNNFHNSSTLSFCFKFYVEIIQPQPIFWSSEISFWIDSIYYQVAILRLGKCEHFIQYHNLLQPFQWNHICIMKTKSETVFVWDINKKFKLNNDICENQLKETHINSFIIGGHLKKTYKEGFMNFRGKITSIFFNIRSYLNPDSTIPILVSVFKWDLVKSFRHIGKTTYIIEEPTPPVIVSLKKLFIGRFDFYEAIFTCYFLNGILSTDWKGIHLSMWSPRNTEHLIFDSFYPDCNSEEWAAIERLQNSKCNIKEIPTFQTKKVDCFDRYAFGCSIIKPFHNYYLRGMSRHLQFIDRHYFHHFENDSTSFYGSRNTFIKRINSTWFIGILPSTILGFYNGSKNYPRGINTWFIHFEEYGDTKLEECVLSFSWCDGKKFACDNGICISFNKICDGNPDCLNYEDEKNCSIVETSLYRKEFPPSAYETNSKTSIRLMFHLNSINYVDEMNNLININFGITLTWHDPRLKFNFIFRQVKYLSEEEKQKLWIPELIFKSISGEDNTFIHQGRGNVFVETNFSRDDIDVKVEELYPKAYINGSNTNISYSFRHNININCFFQFHYYPFDTQICHLRIVLPTQYGNKVHFHSEPSITYGKITLLQLKLLGLTIKSLGADDIVVTMTFTRIFNNIFWTTYVPIFFLQIVSILTLLLPRKKFSTSIMITLTTTLVMYSLYQIVSISLPATPYNKMIDYWLIFALMTPFFTFTIQATFEVWESLKCKTTQNHILITLILKYGQALLILAIFIFDILYWMINLISYYSKNYNQNKSLST